MFSDIGSAGLPCVKGHYMCCSCTSTKHGGHDMLGICHSFSVCKISLKFFIDFYQILGRHIFLQWEQFTGFLDDPKTCFCSPLRLLLP